jgi:cathepsin C
VKSKKPFEGPDFEKAHKFALSMQAKYSSADEIPDSELPENFDWRDI